MDERFYQEAMGRGARYSPAAVETLMELRSALQPGPTPEPTPEERSAAVEQRLAALAERLDLAAHQVRAARAELAARWTRATFEIETFEGRLPVHPPHLRRHAHAVEPRVRLAHRRRVRPRLPTGRRTPAPRLDRRPERCRGAEQASVLPHPGPRARRVYGARPAL